MIYIYAALAILAGATIGLACRVKSDADLWKQRLRNLRQSQRKMDHRKAYFRRPSDTGSAIQPFVELIFIIGMMIAFTFIVFHGFGVQEPRW